MEAAVIELAHEKIWNLKNDTLTKGFKVDNIEPLENE
jgi:hypothetical protein